MPNGDRQRAFHDNHGVATERFLAELTARPAVARGFTAADGCVTILMPHLSASSAACRCRRLREWGEDRRDAHVPQIARAWIG